MSGAKSGAILAAQIRVSLCSTRATRCRPFHDQPINLNPKPRGGTVAVVLGEEGAKQRLGAGRGAEVFQIGARGSWIGGQRREGIGTLY
jgi:hypothetical protein